MSQTTSLIIHANNSPEINDAVSRIITLAKRKLLLFGPRLDLPVFDSDHTCELLTKLISDDRHSRIRILIRDEKYFLGHNRRLLQLCRRFSTFVQVKTISAKSDRINDLFVVVDDCAYLHQMHFDTSVAVANLNARGKAVQFSKRFDESWEHGEYIVELSALGLLQR